MDTSFERMDLLPTGVPTFAVVLMAVAAVALWLGARQLTRRHRARLPLYGVVVPRVLTAVMAAWCVLQLLGRGVTYGSRWPLWTAALGVGLAVEATAELYMRERRLVTRRYGLLLTALRGAALAVLAAVLLQPVLVHVVDRDIVRRVAVLVDESDSMRFVDRQWTVGERLDLAMHARLLSADERALPALEPLAGLRAAVRPWAAGALETNRAPAALQSLLERGALQARELQAQVAALVARAGDGPGDALGRLHRHVRDADAPAFLDALTASAAGRLERAQLVKLADTLDQLVEHAAPARDAADTLCWNGLDGSRRDTIMSYSTTTRLDLAYDILMRPRAQDGALLDALAGRYDIDLLRLGTGVEKLRGVEGRTAAASPAAAGPHDWASMVVSNAAPESVQRAFRAATDYTVALETILRDVPSEQLAGVLILSDGRHNGAAAIDPVARRLGAQGVPVCGIVVGGSRLPFDIAVADVSAPESVYLGDRVRVRTVVRATGAKGRKIRLQMFLDGKPVDSTELEVSTDDWQREARLTHAPEAQGILRYELRTEVQEGELFIDNNAWATDVAVSDDRTNVLLVDDYPRWEFRYLRNLFFGRDKSVHLQYYLVHPDEIASVQTESRPPPASATRRFGDAEAGALPVSRDEWRKFDVIILGDLDPSVLTPEVMEDIRHCVAERGALLVSIAGPRAMPHAFPTDSLLGEMLPVRYTQRAQGAFQSPEEAYRLTLTPSGFSHPVMQQSASISENEAIWSSIPEMHWRFQIDEAKPGADVLAYAVPVDEENAPTEALDVRNAVSRFDEEMRKRSRDALVVAQGYGRGKVLALTFDRTWRLRYCVGDTYHHRFWGQAMRWGLGEKLRDGREGLRVGSDQIIYSPKDPVRILARVLNEDFAAVTDARLTATVRHESGTAVGRVELRYRKDSNGMYEVSIPSLSEPGRYKVELLRHDGGMNETVETSFLVVTSRRPVEMAEASSSRVTMDALARWTGGRVVGPSQARELVDAFGEGRRTLHEPHERPLWDRPWVFLLILALVTSEWILRKRGGLA